MEHFGAPYKDRLLALPKNISLICEGLPVENTPTCLSPFINQDLKSFIKLASSFNLLKLYFSHHGIPHNLAIVFGPGAIF